MIGDIADELWEVRRENGGHGPTAEEASID
jgi:hypothetical protein